MRIGKLSETDLRRFVFGRLKRADPRLVSGPGFGCDSALIDGSFEGIALSSSVVAEDISDKAFYGICRALNNLAASGRECLGIACSVLAPSDISENELGDFFDRLNDLCGESGIALLGGHTQVSGCVSYLVPCFTALGHAKKPGVFREEYKACGNDSVIVTKHIGLEGTAILAHEKEDELSRHFYPGMICAAKLFKQKISIANEAAAAKGAARVLMHDISQGGLYSALWDIAKKTKLGFEIDLKRVPVKQETIEICEYFSINPYELLSGGSLLVVTDNPEAVISAVDGSGENAVCIGQLRDNKKLIIKSALTESCLNRPKADGIYSVL